MKAQLYERLRCPACVGELGGLTITETGTRPFRSAGEIGEGVREGVLLCAACRTWYPIENFVPVMLAFKTAFHDRFATMHRHAIEALEGYSPPGGKPRPGELSVQETFTDEWQAVQGDELSFAYTEEDLQNLHREVWLKWLAEASSVRSVLNVGVGLGKETTALSRVMPDAEIFAVDLNFALLQSGSAFEAQPRVHCAVASLFALPFAPESFDLVYSQGVIHHTYSTKDAFRAIASRVRHAGHLFVWIYGLDDHYILEGHLGFERTRHAIETVARPVVSRLPRAPRDAFFKTTSAVLQPFLRRKVKHGAVWKRRNTEHAMRDWLSPRFAHRHSYNEVLDWFESSGFRVFDVQSPRAFRRLFGRQLWGVGMTGERLP
jgi:SAM-dependent methyltransferase